MTTGMILAGMIVGAALLMRIQTAFTILDYPGLAIILPLAAFGGLTLLFKILFQDERMKKKERTVRST